MNWCDCYPKEEMPTLAQVAAFVASPLWESLCVHVESCYGVLPKIEHSVCSGAPGWNVKYRKGGRALCTLYPAAGYYTCLISVGRREATEAELLLSGCTDAVRNLYWDAKPFNGSRWLMIQVVSPEVLEDVKRLIALRVQK